MNNSATTSRRVLIVGLGISGIATALRLHRLGWEPVILERAPARRKGGYFIGLFGMGQASARRFGILDAMANRHGAQIVTYEVNRANRRRKGINFADVPGAPRMLLRGDVENALFEALPKHVEIRFSTVPTEMKQDEQGVDVTMRHTETGAITTERYDLVVGADGMRSTVRRIVFGPDKDYLYPLKMIIGASVLSKPVVGYTANEGLVMAEAGRSVWVFPFANHHPTVLFSYHVDDVDAQFRRSPIESLRKAYGPQPLGPVLQHLFDEFEAADERLFDSVNQVRIDRWHKGRVVLIGDAAWCLTLYSGMGASSGLAGSELLGHMLEKYPNDIRRALMTWEIQLRPHIASLQENGIRMRALFTPVGETQRVLRAAFLRLASYPATRPIFDKVALREQLNDRDIAAYG